ncbi:Alanine--glyoxylate aminotransferase 2-like [Nymphon striatum]|nr:Alanine--glyoxylate aminotransferase 2-like [Nymphon striatum]
MRGAGQYMFDEMGNKYLDCINNVAHVGHCHPYVVKEGCKQMSVLSTNCRYLHDEIVRYASRLSEKFPGDLSVCFFVNSGSEANDLAIKLAKHYTKGKRLICLDHAYHGNVISVDGISPYKFNHPGATGKPKETYVVPCPDVYRGKYMDKDYPNEDLGLKYAEEVKEIVSNCQNEGHQIAAFIVESLQSCGGQIIYPKNYLKNAFRYVREAGGLCIADEVQIGFGRVGNHMWGFQIYGDDVIPDIVTMGKPMGNGHPVSAVITTREIASAYASRGTYFNTFGGNPVSCAIANAVMDVIENENLQQKAEKVGKYMLQKLKDLKQSHKLIGDVRGHGMFVGIDLVECQDTRKPATMKADYVINRAKQKLVVLSSEGPYANIIKIKPPLVFDEDDVDHLIQVFEDILYEIENDEMDFSYLKGNQTNGEVIKNGISSHN